MSGREPGGDAGPDSGSATATATGPGTGAGPDDPNGSRSGAETGARAIDWGVAAPALILVLAIAVWAIAVPEGFGRASSAAFTWLVDTLGWAFIIAAVVFFIAMIALAF
ncbi:hypothetical protein [Corynebacterium xerosis]|uniref:hypothetical protein n=1 Tax=Corynebacterium xerosis TaxID=1725 RepID=UPI0026BFFA3D